MRARTLLIIQAAEGSLFLDEISDLTAASQVKLLRLLQDGCMVVNSNSNRVRFRSPSEN